MPQTEALCNERHDRRRSTAPADEFDVGCDEIVIGDELVDRGAHDVRRPPEHGACEIVARYTDAIADERESDARTLCITARKIDLADVAEQICRTRRSEGDATPIAERERDAIVAVARLRSHENDARTGERARFYKTCVREPRDVRRPRSDAP